MHWASSISSEADLSLAIEQAAGDLCRQLGDSPVLVMGFASGAHSAELPVLATALQRRFGAAATLGCSAVGVIGGGHEIEGETGLSLVGAHLPGVEAHALRMPADADPGAWVASLELPEDGPLQFLLLPASEDCEVPALLGALDARFPAARKVGGVASTLADEQGAVFGDGVVQTGGAVGVALVGQLGLQTLIAQGCRPVGRPMIVTRCSDNIIRELDVGTPVEALRQLYGTLPERDQALCHHSLMIGIETRSKRGTYGPEDFLVGDVLGMEPKRGAMAVSRRVQSLQVVQFHLRDARSSAEALDRSLAGLPAEARATPAGALLFTCMGRGEALYGHRNHDSDALCRSVGQVPVGGFFCSGEIGPTGAHTFVHGYASAVAIFHGD